MLIKTRVIPERKICKGDGLQSRRPTMMSWRKLEQKIAAQLEHNDVLQYRGIRKWKS